MFSVIIIAVMILVFRESGVQRIKV